MRDVADILIRQKWLIAAWPALICGFLIGYLALSPAKYHSQVTFLLTGPRSVPVLSQGEFLPGPSGAEVTESQMATEIQLLSRKALLERVVEKCNLVQKSTKGSLAERIEKAEKKLSRSLKITPGGKADLITVSYLDYSPEQSVAVLGALSDSYLDHHLQIHRAAGNLTFFLEQASHFETEWREAQARMSAFELRTKVVVLDEQKDLSIRKLNELEASLRDTQSALSETERREEMLLRQVSEAAPRITTQERAMPNQYSVERLNSMIVELSNRRTELLTKFQPDNRLVQEVDQQIAQTQNALTVATASESKEEATDVNPLRQTLEGQLLQSRTTIAGLHARAGTLEAQIAQYGHTVDALGNATGTYDLLAREVKEAEAKYLLYSRQSEEARISEEMDRKRMANVVVMDGPDRPATAEPKLSLDVVFGLLFATAIVLPIAFVRGLRRTQVFTPWELEGVTGIPVLGTVMDASRCSAVRLPGNK
jgi:uncharacterized protein involved in exopolysaccharide biosynthesis